MLAAECGASERCLVFCVLCLYLCRCNSYETKSKNAITSVLYFAKDRILSRIPMKDLYNHSSQCFSVTRIIMSPAVHVVGGYLTAAELRTTKTNWVFVLCFIPDVCCCCFFAEVMQSRGCPWNSNMGEKEYENFLLLSSHICEWAQWLELPDASKFGLLWERWTSKSTPKVCVLQLLLLRACPLVTSLEVLNTWSLKKVYSAHWFLREIIGCSPVRDGLYVLSRVSVAETAVTQTSVLGEVREERWRAGAGLCGKKNGWWDGGGRADDCSEESAAWWE